MSTNNPFSLEGKTILITGASSGIGRAIAIESSKLGACLIINGRNSERLNDTFLHLCGNGHKQLVADLTIKNSFDEIVEKTPILDGVVHCAGLTQTLPFQFINEDALCKIMDINFTAPTILSALLVKKKKLSKGSSIVFISSASGVYCSGLSGSAYSASKGAVNGMMKGMALDLASKGIRVNSVNPAMVETSIFDEGVITSEQLDEDKKRYPLKRYGKPEEVAYAVIYLLSNASAWVTGSNLLIDGGFTLL